MKRLFSVLMLMLVLVLASGGNLSGHNRNLDSGDTGGAGGPSVGSPTGDDHPWGGDQISIGTPITNRSVNKGESVKTGIVRSFITRMVYWYLLDNVELKTTSQETVVDTRSSDDTGSRPATHRSSTTNQQGDKR
jgi:hypothetical protein